MTPFLIHENMWPMSTYTNTHWDLNLVAGFLSSEDGDSLVIDWYDEDRGLVSEVRHEDRRFKVDTDNGVVTVREMISCPE